MFRSSGPPFSFIEKKDVNDLSTEFIGRYFVTWSQEESWILLPETKLEIYRARRSERDLADSMSQQVTLILQRSAWSILNQSCCLYICANLECEIPNWRATAL